MTSEQIFAIRDLRYLYKLWHSIINDSEKIDVASMIDRIEAFNKQNEKENYNINDSPVIKNEKYKDII